MASPWTFFLNSTSTPLNQVRHKHKENSGTDGNSHNCKYLESLNNSLLLHGQELTDFTFQNKEKKKESLVMS